MAVPGEAARSKIRPVVALTRYAGQSPLPRSVDWCPGAGCHYPDKSRHLADAVGQFLPAASQGFSQSVSHSLSSIPQTGTEPLPDLSHLRARAEEAIERLIDGRQLDAADKLICLLDDLDGAPDLEPELAA